MGRTSSTVCREVAAHGSRREYRAWRADEHAVRAARRPKIPKLARHPRLRAEVEHRLAQRWSPQQISRRLVLDFPDDPEMRVSHETIYRSLFVQARGGLRKELTRHLRSGRTQRRSLGRAAGAGRLRDMVSISERPAAVEDRAVSGSWRRATPDRLRAWLFRLPGRFTRHARKTYLQLRREKPLRGRLLAALRRIARLRGPPLVATG